LSPAREVEKAGVLSANARMVTQSRFIGTPSLQVVKMPSPGQIDQAFSGIL
jgi:hypothetical protein